MNVSSKAYYDLAKEQIDYMLGTSGPSYVIGYGSDYPTQPHHAARCDFFFFFSKTVFRFCLFLQFLPGQTGTVRLGALQIERVESSNLVRGLGEWSFTERLLRRQTFRVSLQSSDDRLQFGFSGRPGRFDSLRETVDCVKDENKRNTVKEKFYFENGCARTIATK